MLSKNPSGLLEKKKSLSFLIIIREEFLLQQSTDAQIKSISAGVASLSTTRKSMDRHVTLQ
jgi:hypothetical protein